MNSRARIAISVTALGVATVVTGIAPAAAAHDSNKPIPNPCKTFTAKSVDTLFGVSPSAKPHKKLTVYSAGQPNESRQCTVTYHHHSMFVSTARMVSGSGGGFDSKVYNRPKLGKDGRIEVSHPPQAFTLATYERHGVHYADNIGETLPHKGRAMYQFALVQSKRVKHG